MPTKHAPYLLALAAPRRLHAHRTRARAAHCRRSAHISSRSTLIDAYITLVHTHMHTNTHVGAQTKAASPTAPVGCQTSTLSRPSPSRARATPQHISIYISSAHSLKNLIRAIDPYAIAFATKTTRQRAYERVRCASKCASLGTPQQVHVASQARTSLLDAPATPPEPFGSRSRTPLVGCPRTHCVEQIKIAAF